MSRPAAIVAILLAALAAPNAVRSQDAAARVGVLGPDEEPRFSETVSGLRRGLEEQGYGAERVRVLEGRAQRGNEAAARAVARALADQGLDALLVLGSALVRPARESAPRVPIVLITPGDPVAAGLAESLARPGGNLTAMTFEYPELSAKRLELLRELQPRLRRVLILYDPRDASPRQGAAAARAAAGALSITLVERAVRNADEITLALKELDGVEALLGIPGGVTSGHYEQMVQAANAKRIPSVFHTRTHGTGDAVLTYGASDVDLARQAARLLDKILKGTPAGELPVERPSRLALVVNLRAARALGLSVPPALLVRADAVIE
ncbi:MAG TPA: ABC transporter substrate-binding protein [Burkholderiales bacterium]|nr:ABC transporter substrate-binding protein [Burkholderiales bacterium]